ncbi:MAG: sugar phosphate isomerase/epimerase [Planctomycetes bacterium]|nr:sugar phosphate isomerase/epimerase [Planctomycetota bacterium]
MIRVERRPPPERRHPRVGFHVSAFGSQQVLAALSALSRDGFQGLEVYGDTTHIFADQPGEFRTILEITGIDLAGVHGGGLLTSEEFREAEIIEWKRLLRWVADVGGHYAIFYGGEAHVDSETDLRRAASFLNEIGRFAAEAAVKLCYEPDLKCPFNTKEAIASLMRMTDPQFVWLSADTANLTSMGLDPSLFLLSMRQRIAVVHVRDLTDPAIQRSEDSTASTESPFCEIGTGTVDLEGVADALRAVQFDGWVVGVVDQPARSAHESARAAAKYFREFLGLEF